jgi:hypothetical protein
VPSGNAPAMAAATVAPPTARSSARRVAAAGKAARSTASRTSPPIAPSGPASSASSPPCRAQPQPAACRAPGAKGMRTVRPYSAALAVIAGSLLAAQGGPDSMGSDGSRLHSFQEPKYIRTSLMPASLSATSEFEARAPLKQ